MNEEKKLPKIWHPQQEKILKAWGEAAACYIDLNINIHDDCFFPLPTLPLNWCN